MTMNLTDAGPAAGPADKGHGRTAGEPGSWARWRRRSLDWLFASPVYRWTLSGRVPADLARRPNATWPGEAELGNALLAGELRFAGQTIRDPAPLWAPPGATADWLAELHGFAWLDDLATVGTPAARETARVFVRRWIEDNRDWHPIAWRADVVGTRLAFWTLHFDALVGRDERADGMKRLVLASLMRQLRHLERVAGWETTGSARLAAVKGLVFALVATGAGERRIERALSLLEREIASQVRPDGGHVERSPQVQLTVLRDLIDLRLVLRMAELALPEGLQGAIDRMAPMLRFFRHGDGRLAQFNDTAESYGNLVDLVLTRSEAKGRAPASAPHTGFNRLHAGRTIVIVDSGRPPPVGLDRHAHAGTLSFEMSHGRDRLIVNCGAYRGPSGDWHRVARSTAAHSTLVVADVNSSELSADGTLGRRPAEVVCEREEADGSQWITASHDGYQPRFGLTHRRRLFLSADGDDLRGEDHLTGRPSETFAIRFHLHPGVQVSLIQDGGAALLRLPSGTGFRLRVQGAQLGLAESIYLGTGETRKSQQLVLAGHVGSQGAVVQWAIRREARKPGEEA